MRPIIAISMNRDATSDVGARDWLRQAYVDAIVGAGGVPLAVPNTLAAIDFLNQAHGLVLTGGGDVDPQWFGQPDQGTDWQSVDPVRDRTELALARAAADRGLPMLGICRGMQVLACAFGGTLIQNLGRQTAAHRQTSARHLAQHEVRLAPESRIARALGASCVAVNSFHHQAVDQVPAGWRACGWSADGVLEAMEGAADEFQLGVQWHPEDLVPHDAMQCRLFAALVEAARG